MTTNRLTNNTGSPRERCERCGNYLVICGHNEPFEERVRTHHIDKSSLKVRRRA